MNAVLLTESGLKRGIGHLVRCQALAQGFSERGVKSKVLVDSDIPVSNLLNGTDFELLDWKTDPSLEDKLSGIEIAVIDSYEAPLSLYRKVASLVHQCVYFDDYRRMDYPTGVVVNGALCAERLEYQFAEGIQYLLGPAYQPLRSCFWDVPDITIRSDVASVLVTFGGSDPTNMTPLVLQQLKTFLRPTRIHVVIGPAFQYRSEIEKQSTGSMVSLYEMPDVKTIKHLMLKSDIAISAAGQTLFELSRIGLPAVAVCVAENQRLNVEGFLEVGTVLPLEIEAIEDSPKNLERAVSALLPKSRRQEMSSKGRLLVDGQGIRRIVEEVLQI